MRAFELYDATTVSQAVDLLRQNSNRAVKVVGGGSDLVGGIMKDWVHGNGLPFPDVLIDLATIKELTAIKVDGGSITIGAAVTLSDVINNKDIADRFPLLVSAASSVASPLIRNFGTLGGNINQRPRCWFFRGEDFNCYKKGGDFCYAVTGDISREGRRGRPQGQGHQGHHQAGGGADPHRRPPDEPQRVQGRGRARPDRANGPGSTRQLIAAFPGTRGRQPQGCRLSVCLRGLLYLAVPVADELEALERPGVRGGVR